MKITRAQRKDAQELTALTLRSKDFWNYGKAQIEAWTEELTISGDYIEANEVFQLKDEELIGYYAFDDLSHQKIKINFLFLEPKFIGKGYGQKLLSDCIDRVKSLGYKSVTLDADPNAEPFYQKYGFKVVGQLETSIKDRFLPIMERSI